MLHSRAGFTHNVEGKVRHMLKELNMTSCADTQMWLLSGGERKRCSIMTELLGEYRMMIMDEVFSGLDSAVAHTLLANLKALTRRANKIAVTMIISIHQPSTAMFYAFDKVMFLSEGKIAYFGPPSVCAKYLSHIGYTLPTGHNDMHGYNPADYMIELLFSTELQLVDLEMQGTGQSEETIVNTADHNHYQYTSYIVTRFAPRYVGWWPRYILTDLYNNEDMMMELKCISHVAVSNTASFLNQVPSEQYQQTFLFELWILLQRGWKCANRSSSISRYNIIEVVFVATLAGLTWFHLQTTLETDIPKMSGFLFFCCCYWLFAGLYSGLLSFLPEKIVVKKERAVGMYRLYSYYAAKTIGSLPVRTILPFVFGMVSSMLAFQKWQLRKATSMISILILCALTGESVGICIGALIDDLDWSISAANIFALTTCIFGGFYIRILPWMVAPLRYFSVLRYGFDAAVQMHLRQEDQVQCNGSGMIVFPCYNRHQISGLDARKWLEVEQLTLLQNLAASLLCYAICRSLGFVAMRWRELRGS